MNDQPERFDALTTKVDRWDVHMPIIESRHWVALVVELTSTETPPLTLLLDPANAAQLGAALSHSAGEATKRG